MGFITNHNKIKTITREEQAGWEVHIDIGWAVMDPKPITAAHPQEMPDWSLAFKVCCFEDHKERTN